MANIEIKERKGDSLEYGIFETCLSFIKEPVGTTMEVGVRDGFGSKVIIDAWRKLHGKSPLVHLGLDPYGNIDYNGADDLKNVKYDYTNDMKQDMLQYMSAFYPEFHFVNLDDKEFFSKFVNGYPIYREEKIMIRKYDLVHLDGPHDTDSVLNEIKWFLPRAAKQCCIVIDDQKAFDIQKIIDFTSNFTCLDNPDYCKFKLQYLGERKAVFMNFEVDKEQPKT